MLRTSQLEFQKFKGEIQRVSTLVMKGMYDVAEDQLTQILASASQLAKEHQTILQVDVLTLRGKIASRKGEINHGISILSDALSIAESASYVAGIADIMNNLGSAQRQLGQDLELAKEYYLEALEIEGQTQDNRGIATSLNGLGLVEFTLGAFEEALRQFEACKDIFQELEDKSGEANALNNIAEIHRVRGELAIAEKYYKEALDLFQEAQDYNGEAICLLNLGWIMWGQNCLLIAIRHLRKSLGVMENIKAGGMNYVEILVALAGALIDLENADSAYTESEKLLAKAHNHAQSIDSLSSIIMCYYFQGYLEQARGNWARAEELFLEALAKGKGTNFEYMTKSLLALAEIFLTRYLNSFEKKYLEEFEKRINEASILAQEYKLFVMLCEIYVLKGLYAASTNNYDQASTFLTQAIILADEKQLPRQKERAEKEFTNIQESSRRIKIKTGILPDDEALVYVQNYLEDVTEILKRRKTIKET
ncbi:MAG: tetratricopeptide repeat protein [Candidatus Hermodarchaeota archaeon]